MLNPMMSPKRFNSALLAITDIAALRKALESPKFSIKQHNTIARRLNELAPRKRVTHPVHSSNLMELF